MRLAVTLVASVPLLVSLVLPTASLAAPKLGEKPKTVELKDDTGGRVDGTPWSSSMIKDKVWALFYVDPDHRDKNEQLKEALKKEEFPKEKYSSIAVINMDASWVPNALIGSSIASNQEKYPDVIYVKDKKKALVKEWGLADDAYVVVLFDKQGNIVFNHEGDFADSDVQALIKLIKERMND